ncbi:OsmC family peroxiredoxin [Tessaracoccus sp. ZS01]|uniref:OsmC family peroxiredoxin n=1 Tax=Tessaracoccus sp. ZS01 TaxID=1906324 RepID=UPI00096D45C1|nr:OsmC family peroxiredoxin [Tessaracoccus sp. ZS01]MCG6566857.1 peroxiredoxin [Tessaracoccus sp. ZS01]OMG57994.1 peroxiredoxin [Tessaracoccus sp. ZS01]
MPNPVVSKASTVWNGDLFTGKGTTTLDSSGSGSFPVEWNARAEGSDVTTTPEELLAAAHATCFSMAFSNELKKNGTPPTEITTNAEVSFVAGTGVTGIHLITNVQADGLDEETFQTIANGAKENCPISQALKAVEITLEATLA